MRAIVRTFIIVLLVACGHEARAADRVALVIGNGSYRDSPLANPTNDAADMAKALQGFGFHVILKRNANTREMRQAIREFGTELRRAKVGLFYFAGHGISIRGANYLIPVGVDLQNEADVEDLAIDANYALRTMEEAQVEVSIAILDACRNNPFGRSFRSASRGLAQMTAATGSVIAFSTAPGSVAADGQGRNGTYTKNLLASLGQGDTDILKVFQRTRAAVVKETGGKQTPWESTSLVGDFSFRGSTPAQPALAMAAPSSDSVPRTASPWDPLMNANFDYGGLLDELSRFVRDDPAPVSNLRVQADAGEPLGLLRWCLLSTHERFNLGLRPEDAMNQCRDVADHGSPVGMYAYGHAFITDKRATKQYSEGMPWITKAAEKGFAPAMYNLAYVYLRGEAGAPKDEALGARWMRQAADANYPAALYALGDMYFRGIAPLAKDLSEGARLIRRAADMGFPDAIQYVGWMYSSGNGVTKDEVEAVRWFRKAIEAGSALAHARLGSMYLTGAGGLSKDDAEAFRLFKLSSEKGSLTGTSHLAWAYLVGRGTTKDPAESTRLYKWAAEKGDLEAMNSYAMALRLGTGITANPAEALKWYQKAADLGHPGAMVDLGFMYRTGQGTAVDIPQAVRWYRQSAEKGNTLGMTNVGWLYETGTGVTKDLSEAVRWYRRGAEAGYPGAMVNLGLMYERGAGVTTDAAEAARWFRRAHDLGYARGTANLGNVTARGAGVARDDAEAVRLFQIASDRGDGWAMVSLGNMYRDGRGGLSKDSDRAAELYRKAVDTGDTFAREQAEKQLQALRK